MKINLNHNPLAPSNAAVNNFERAYRTRPAWITSATTSFPPEVVAFRLRFELPQPTVIRSHASADERYQLFLDGQRIGRGPERGSDRTWFYDTYDLDLSAGKHILTTLVWRLGEIGPLAQIGLKGGFILEAEGSFSELISTRSAIWETRPINGISFHNPELPQVGAAWFVEPIQVTDGSTYAWDIENGVGEGWTPAVRRVEDFTFLFGIQPEHVLQPAMLPAQISTKRLGGRVCLVAAGTWSDAQSVRVDTDANIPVEAAAWQALVDGSAHLIVPPHTRRQVIIDLGDYVCAYPQIQLSGGQASRVTIGWAEALHLDAAGQAKGQRDEIASRVFNAFARDVIISDGGTCRMFEPLWWRAGRYVELLIESSDQPLTVETFCLLETRYPLEMESSFSSSDERLGSVIPIALRGLQMCAHETYMDCPYYEQMMYVGDTRLEALTTYVISADDRLPRKAIQLFALSCLPDGSIQARYPARDIQVIPPFSLWWVGMVYDYAMWRGDRQFIASLLPIVRVVLDGFLAHIESNNLLRSPNGWNFTDWVSEWPLGTPPDGFDGISGPLNWHLVYTLGLAIRLEEWAGDTLLAQLWQGWRDRVASAVKAAFWDEQRGLFADDLAHTRYSEHTQCLALLSGLLDGKQKRRTGESLLSDATLTRATIYFTHYLFETYYLLNASAAFFERMKLWFDLPAQGFKTTPEQPEPSRSDCHGWGAHPLYHCFASLLGIRPASFGFESVEIAPMPGHLAHLSGTMVYPHGQVTVDLDFETDLVSGSISLPAGINGVFRYQGKTVNLHQGNQTFKM